MRGDVTYVDVTKECGTRVGRDGGLIPVTVTIQVPSDFFPPAGWTQERPCPWGGGTVTFTADDVNAALGRPIEESPDEPAPRS